MVTGFNLLSSTGPILNLTTQDPDHDPVFTMDNGNIISLKDKRKSTEDKGLFVNAEEFFQNFVNNLKNVKE